MRARRRPPPRAGRTAQPIGRRALHAALRVLEPSPVVELNLAVAVAMADRPATGLIRDGSLARYPYLHAERADLLRRLARWTESAIAYSPALELTDNRAERAFLERRLAEVSAARNDAGRIS